MNYVYCTNYVYCVHCICFGCHYGLNIQSKLHSELALGLHTHTPFEGNNNIGNSEFFCKNAVLCIWIMLRADLCIGNSKYSLISFQLLYLWLGMVYVSALTEHNIFSDASFWSKDFSSWLLQRERAGQWLTTVKFLPLCQVLNHNQISWNKWLNIQLQLGLHPRILKG